MNIEKKLEDKTKVLNSLIERRNQLQNQLQQVNNSIQQHIGAINQLRELMPEDEAKEVEGEVRERAEEFMKKEKEKLM
jgi:uncharacterized membrane protein YukC